MSETQNESATPLAEPAAEQPEIATRGLFADLADRAQRAFLAGFVAGKGLKRAEELSKVSRWCHYEWMKKDTAYRERFRQAKTILADEAEEEAYRRAFVGCDVPVFHSGKVPGSRKSYSDALAQFLLKGMKPRVYGKYAGEFPEGPTEMIIRVVPPEDREKARAEEGAAAESARTISIPIGGDAAPGERDHLKEKP